MIYAIVTLNPRRKFGDTYATVHAAQAAGIEHYNEHNWVVKSFTDSTALHAWLRGIPDGRMTPAPAVDTRMQMDALFKEYLATLPDDENDKDESWYTPRAEAAEVFEGFQEWLAK